MTLQPVDWIAATVLTVTLLALVADQLALRRARLRALAEVRGGHDYTLLPGGWPLHLSTCWCRPQDGRP